MCRIKHGANIAKFLLTILLLGLVYGQIQEKKLSWETILPVLLHIKFGLIVFYVVLLMPLNWAFEAWKWQAIAHKIEKISFWQAFQAVLLGVSLSSFAPALLGDFAGKIALLTSENRLKSTYGIFLNNFIQTLIAIILGFIAYGHFIFQLSPKPLIVHFTILLVFLIGIFASLYFLKNTQRFANFLSKKFKITIETINNELIFQLCLLSFGRYWVFSLQFLLLLKSVFSSISLLDLWVGVSLIFFTKTLLSNIHFLFDIGSRASIALYYFSFFHVDSSLVLAISLFIWFLNVLIPMLIGSIFVWKMKFFNKIPNA